MRTCTRAALCALLAPALAAARQQAPNAKEQDQLAAEFLAADAATAAGHARQLEILARLVTLPPLDARTTATWQGKIKKLWSKGRKLEPTGDHWFWPAAAKQHREPRGRYLVGGKTTAPMGLAINMHGGGVGEGDAGGAAAAYDAVLGQLGLLMIAPEVLEKTECGWTDAGTEEFVLDLVDAALRTWKLDPDHVYFVGHSMGGYGSWALGGHHADRVAAIAPAAGAPTPIREQVGGPIVDMQSGVIPSLRNVFVSVYQSLDDPQVTPESNQFAVRLLREAQAKWGAFAHDYWQVDGRGHGAPPGGYGAQLQKIVGRTRNAVPERIVWQPALAWKRQFYWLYWQDPAIDAVVVADLDREHNAVHITCDRPSDGLWVLLDQRVLDLGKEVVVTVNGHETFRGHAAAELGTLLRTSQHPDPQLQFAARVRAFVGKE